MAVNYTEEQLNNVDKSFLIQLLLQQQEQLNALTKELHASNEKMQLLMEQVILGKQNRFGRSSEKIEDTSQICFCEVDGMIVFFNEAEAVCELNAAEPDDLELKPSKQPKRKGKREADLSGLPVRRIDHYLSQEELEAEFGVRGWKQLPDAISRKYHFVPAKVEVEEHHIGVYASKTDEHMVKAGHPKALLHGSLVSPSLGVELKDFHYYLCRRLGGGMEISMEREYFQNELTKSSRHIHTASSFVRSSGLPYLQEVGELTALAP